MSINYPDQFSVMLDALMRDSYQPSVEVLKKFKNHRTTKALKALRCRNIFIPATGSFLNANTSDSFTVYTQPLGSDVIVFGCSLSNDIKPTNNTLSVIRGEIRIRPPAPLSDNYIQPQKAFGPATYSVFFPCPFVLDAGDQIAIDFGFNAPEANDAAVDSQEQQILFFCVQVKDCLDADDQVIEQQILSEIQGRIYQRRLLVPCTNSQAGLGGQDIVVLDANGQGEAVTRPIMATTLVTGYSIANHGSIRIALADTATQHSFTLGQRVKAPNLFDAFETIENGIVGPYYSYFRLPVPHLLRPGAQLACSAIDGLAGAPTGPNSFALLFELVTI